MRFSRRKSTADLWGGREPKPEPYTALTERAGSWVQREEISRGKAWPVVSKVHASFHHPPAPHLGSFPVPPPILVLSRGAGSCRVIRSKSTLRLGAGLFSKCYLSPTLSLAWDGGFLRGIPTCTQGWSDGLKVHGRHQKILIICCKMSWLQKLSSLRALPCFSGILVETLFAPVLQTD